MVEFSQVYEAKGLRAPQWAQINWIAHSEPSTIIDRVRSEVGLQRPPGTWPWAVNTMAHELLSRAGNNDAFMRLLQRECLIPVEIDLLRSKAGCFLPEHFVVIGVPRLRTHPIDRAP